MRSCQACAALVLILGAGLTAAGEGKPLTPAEARKQVGKEVTVEMTGRAAKDRLQKRGEIYLDSEADFKDEKNFAVVITRDGAASLKVAGIGNPAEHFQGKKIRASGTVKEVDNVPRIEVDKAGQIRLAEGKSSAPKKPATLTVENERGEATTLSVADLARLPRHKARVKGHGGEATYEGATLADVLLAAKVTLGKGLKGPLLANCLVAEAADGYRVVFSLPEVDPAMTDRVVLVADRKDGNPLDDKEGPYRLVVPHDKFGMRWVKRLERLSVGPAGPDRPARASAALRGLGGKVVVDEKTPGRPVIRINLSGT